MIPKIPFLVLTGIAAACPASGQVRVAKPEPIAAAPVAQPEPAVPVVEDPLSLFQKLIGSSAEQRRQAIVELGWMGDEQFAEDPTFIQNARFDRVNLDDDPDYEAIMTVDIGFPPATRILIFKRESNQWLQVGKFSLVYMWGPDEAEHMLELRNIVDFDHKDIVIRLTSGGTDIQKEILLSIYRLHQGRLYRTFETIEDFALRRFPAPGAMIIEDEINHIDYPELKRSEGVYIVLRSWKDLVKASDWELQKKHPKLVSCVPYRWDASKYTFIADQTTAPKFCQAAPGPGRRTSEK